MWGVGSWNNICPSSMPVKVFISCVHVVLEFGLVHFVRFNVLNPHFHASENNPSQKECNSHFLRSQTISSLTKFIQKVLTFMSPNRCSMKTYSIIYLMILIVYHKLLVLFTWIWSNLKLFASLGSESCNLFGTEYLCAHLHVPRWGTVTANINGDKLPNAPFLIVYWILSYGLEIRGTSLLITNLFCHTLC